MSKKSKSPAIDEEAEYYIECDPSHEDCGVVWKIKKDLMWVWSPKDNEWSQAGSNWIEDVTTYKTKITPHYALSIISQIRFPLHLVNDAQGPCGIMDDKGQAVVWFSETFQPNRGYVWKPETEHTHDRLGHLGTTCYSLRNRVIREILEKLNELLG